MNKKNKIAKYAGRILGIVVLTFIAFQGGCGDQEERKEDQSPEPVVQPQAAKHKPELIPGTFQGDEKTAQYYANKWYQKAMALWNQNGAGYSQPDSAFFYIENALYYYEFAAGYNMRGQVKVQLGKIQEAIPDYDRAIALDSTLAQPYFNRGTAYYIMSNISQACESWKKAAALGMKNANMAMQQYCI